MILNVMLFFGLVWLLFSVVVVVFVWLFFSCLMVISIRKGTYSNWCSSSHICMKMLLAKVSKEGIGRWLVILVRRVWRYISAKKYKINLSYVYHHRMKNKNMVIKYQKPNDCSIALQGEVEWNDVNWRYRNGIIRT